MLPILNHYDIINLHLTQCLQSQNVFERGLADFMRNCKQKAENCSSSFMVLADDHNQEINRIKWFNGFHEY